MALVLSVEAAGPDTIVVSGGLLSRATTANGDRLETWPQTMPAIGSLDVVTSVRTPSTLCSRRTSVSGICAGS